MKISNTPTLANIPPRAPATAPTPAPAQPADQVSLGDDNQGPTQADRLAHFVQSAKLSAVESLGSYSSAAMGYLVGACAGALISTPLALSLGNMYVMTGGTAAAGGLGALAGHLLDKRKKPAQEDGALRQGAEAVGTAATMLRSIAYPTLVNATGAERELVYRALDSIPMSGVNSVKTIDLVDGLQKQGIAGVAHPIMSQNRILLDKAEMGIRSSWGEDVTIHEVGHTHDFTRGFGPLGSRSQWAGGFGKAPFISEYAHTNRMEDYAESYLNYHRYRDQLHAQTPGKEAALAASHREGVTDVLRNRESVRETGKKIGEVLGSVPYLRTGVELGLSLIAPLQIHHGAGQLEAGLESGSDELKLDGKMNLAKGAFLTLGMAPLSLATTAAHMALKHQVDRGSMTAADASSVANAVLAVSTGPVGMVGAAAGSELRKAGVDLDDTRVRAPLEKGSAMGTVLATISGAAAGGVLGSLLGTAMGGVVGGIGGLMWGQLSGAALGFGGYTAAQTLRQDRREGDPLALTGGDKAWLGKVLGPTLVGGVGGTIAGGYLGAMAGEAIGAAVGGPVGAVTGGFLGRAAGVMGGSYALAKAGAVAGRAWAGTAEGGSAAE